MNNSFVEELRERVSIVDVVGRQVALTKRGSDYWGLCPFHGEKTASFSVCSCKGFYHCFGCGETGDIFQFVMKFFNFDFGEAVKYLAEIAGLPVPTNKTIEQSVKENTVLELLDSAASVYEKYLYESVGSKALKYLESRGFTNEIIKKYRIGFAPANNKITKLASAYRNDVIKSSSLVVERNSKKYDFFWNRIMFPITNSRGQVIAFSGRVIDDTEPKYLNSLSSDVFAKKRTLFGLYHAKESIYKKRRIIVVEGQIDAIKMQCNGFEETVAPLGCALTDEHIQAINSLSHNITFCFDGDKAGLRASVRVLKMFLPVATGSHANVNFAFLPEGKDPDEVLKEGKGVMENVINNSKKWYDFLWEVILMECGTENILSVANIRPSITKVISLIKDEELAKGMKEALLAKYYERYSTKGITKEMLQ